MVFGTQALSFMARSITMEVESATMHRQPHLSVSNNKICEAKMAKRLTNFVFVDDLGEPTKVLDLGSTEIPEEVFMELLQEISPRFTMSTYDVFNHNCNNFTDEVAQLVLGEGIPKEIVDLPKEFLATPMGKSLGPMIMGQQ